MEWHSFFVEVLWNVGHLGLPGIKDLVTTWSLIFRDFDLRATKVVVM